jgi:hypothetical protein|tara:strand:+ start:303 stop:584 length:282 start_codon:yes stop_codon:yes gene_type:complete
MSGQTHGGKGDRPRIIEDRVQFDNNWDKIFGSKKAEEALPDPVAREIEEDSVRLDDVERKLKEWGMMYDCLQNMAIYEYPVEEAKELLKRIKV